MSFVRRRSVFLASLLSAGLIAAGGVPALAASPVPAAVTPVTGSWGTAQAVPGLTAYGEIDVPSVSCVPRGACYAVGDNYDTKPADLPFISTDAGGNWDKRP